MGQYGAIDCCVCAVVLLISCWQFGFISFLFLFIRMESDLQFRWIYAPAQLGDRKFFIQNKSLLWPFMCVNCLDWQSMRFGRCSPSKPLSSARLGVQSINARVFYPTALTEMWTRSQGQTWHVLDLTILTHTTHSLLHSIVFWPCG